MQVEELRASNLNLEKEVALLKRNEVPRVLTEQQMRLISSELRPYAGATVNVIVGSIDKEARDYWGQFSQAIEAAGVETSVSFIVANAMVGFAIKVEPATAQPPVIQGIERAMKEAHVSFSVETMTRLDEKRWMGKPFWIYVGIKPRWHPAD